MILQELLSEQRAAILSIADCQVASNVRIFGSVARGEENENSDIDFLIDYELQRNSPGFSQFVLL